MRWRSKVKNVVRVASLVCRKCSAVWAFLSLMAQSILTVCFRLRLWTRRAIPSLVSSGSGRRFPTRRSSATTLTRTRTLRARPCQAFGLRLARLVHRSPVTLRFATPRVSCLARLILLSGMLLLLSPGCSTGYRAEVGLAWNALQLQVAVESPNSLRTNALQALSSGGMSP
jgi:hypothetical protein